jgi:hypothetical protein
MDESCSTKYAYVSCCLVIGINILYLIFTLIKLFIQQQRRQFPRQIQKMTETTIKNGLERLAKLYPHVNDDTPLPSKWNGKEKALTLVLQQNNLVVTYKGRHF